jgi:hypothetical protein
MIKTKHKHGLEHYFQNFTQKNMFKKIVFSAAFSKNGGRATANFPGQSFPFYDQF